MKYFTNSYLNDYNILKNAKIGAFGEIYWKDAVYNSTNEKWNYDISPEYINFNGVSI